MVFDSILNIAMYKLTYAYFEDIIAFVRNSDLQTFVEGRYEINNHEAFALVNKYDTKPIKDCFIEGHNIYTDIHIMIRGTENIGVCQRSDCVVHPYEQENDFLKMEGSVDLITLKPGLFALFLPQDGHMPKIMVGSNVQPVTKMVIKFPI